MPSVSKIMSAANNFCASRAQSQTCLNYAEAMPEIMSEANNFSSSESRSNAVPELVESLCKSRAETKRSLNLSKGPVWVMPRRSQRYSRAQHWLCRAWATWAKRIKSKVKSQQLNDSTTKRFNIFYYLRSCYGITSSVYRANKSIVA